MDITGLPKEVLFDLLLKVEPHEIDIVCRSKNSRVRAICSSKLFQEAYKLKYPRKLMTGEISVSKQFHEIYIFTDEKGNKITIERGSGVIQYIPAKQIYPSTYKLSDFIFNQENPIMIHIERDTVSFKYEMKIGREHLYRTANLENENRIIDAFNQEVREFLTYIERTNWYDEKTNYLDIWQTDNKLIKEFYDDIVDALKDVKIEGKTIWEKLNLGFL